MKKKNILKIILIVMVYSFIASVVNECTYMSMIFFSAMIFASFLFTIKNYENKSLKILNIIVFIAFLILVIYNSRYKSLPFTSADWANFDYFATSAIAEGGFLLFSAVDLFTGIIATLYTIFGADINMIFFFSLPFTYLTTNYLYKTVYMISSNKSKAELVSSIYIITPLIFIFSLSVLRETAIEFFVIFSFYNFYKYYKNNFKKNLVVALISAAIASMMHSGMIILIFVYLYAACQRKKFKIFNLKAIFLVLLIFVIVYNTPIYQQIASRFYWITLENLVYEVNRWNQYISASRSYISTVSDTLLGLIADIPYRFFMFSTSPYPWQIYDRNTIIVMIFDGTIRWFIAICVIIIFKNIYKKKYVLKDLNIIKIILLIMFMFNLIFCYGTSNYDTAMRHRTKIYPIELVLISCFIFNKKDKNSEKCKKETQIKRIYNPNNKIKNNNLYDVNLDNILNYGKINNLLIDVEQKIENMKTDFKWIIVNDVEEKKYYKEKLLQKVKEKSTSSNTNLIKINQLSIANKWDETLKDVYYEK